MRGSSSDGADSDKGLGRVVGTLDHLVSDSAADSLVANSSAFRMSRFAEISLNNHTCLLGNCAIGLAYTNSTESERRDDSCETRVCDHDIELDEWLEVL